ncbi:exosortase-dependent surface protein XDP1 [Aestuariibacter sp. A3R04]|uniref:exosortase-dependent surface protein XDP1 n=1 Tax=Aestuariibacter sp. A3R04 TaxID=2841571 RepID=UPI001C09E42E|nr:exosortase-dependent surface protein XDP1 [Aestuariibacter sp. A3R04]MBU3021919.1 PEP-CTERM sorting domain-containing protein [Aestuariibacter sp. A3R04]
MKISKIALVTALAAAGVLSTPAFATGGGWHGGCGTGSNTGSGCNATDYFGDDLMYSLASDGITNAEVDGVTINASAYSDTKGWEKTGTHYGYDVVSDLNIEEAKLKKYGQGYGVVNEDETAKHSPDHSVDNEKEEGWVWKNGTYEYQIDTDYDYVLISFDEAVNVTGATFSWLWKDDDTQVSVAALNDTSMLESGSNTWSDVAGDAMAVGSFDVLNCDDDHLAMVELENIYSQYWIIGAYNTVFGDIGHKMFDDGFKLASIGFNTKGKPPTAVTEPGTFAMLFMGGALAMWRRKRKA